MIGRRQFLVQAGSILILPFFCLVLTGQTAKAPAPVAEPWTFEEFASSCIDLGRYDALTRQLTVHFNNKNKDRFYRYSNVQPEVWAKLRKLNESGGVGGYLIETIVQNPKKHPFEQLIIGEFKVRSNEKVNGTNSPPIQKK